MSTTRFVVISPGRSGSHLLRALLGAHPQVTCYGELFNHDAYGPGTIPALAGDDAGALFTGRDADPAALLRHLLYPEREAGAAATGFVLLYQQGNLDANGVLWRTLQEMAELRVIHLLRHNLLRRYFSFRKATVTGVWGPDSNDEARELRLTLRYAECINDFWRVTRRSRIVQEKFADRPILSLAYERLVADPDRELARVQRYLDLSITPLASGTRKQSGLPLEQAIVNYHELRESFAGSEWSWFFDE